MTDGIREGRRWVGDMGERDPQPGTAPEGALAAALAVLGRATTPRRPAPPASPGRPPAPRDGGAARPDRAGVRMRRLAGELHDGAVQELLVAGYDLVELTETAGLDADAQELVERAASRIDDAYDQLRRVLTEMSREDDPTDPDLPLLDALRACSSGPLVPARVRVEVIGPESGPEPTGAARDVAIRAVREGLVNVRKHATASCALVTIRRGRRWWKLDVDDDGAGNEHELRGLLRARRPDSYGLPSLAADAAMVGGRVWIGVAPDLGGIRVSTSVPARRA